MTAQLRQIGRDLQSKLKEFFESSLSPDATPLEILQAALEELERRVQPAGRGRRVFPYSRVVLRVAQPGADQAAIEAIFADFPARLRARFAELQCECPDAIATEGILSDGSDGSPVLSVHCFADPAQAPAPRAAAQRPPITITVLKGQCGQSDYTLDEPVIAIGRLAEPTDALGQVRYNHVAFSDTRDGINETVGRAHARLQYDDAAGAYYLFNESSSNPTSIIRGGKPIRVVPRDPRGVRVQSGDQIQLGRALLKVVLQ